eukprot:gene5595-biopygen11759
MSGWEKGAWAGGRPAATRLQGEGEVEMGTEPSPEDWPHLITLWSSTAPLLRSDGPATTNDNRSTENPQWTTLGTVLRAVGRAALPRDLLCEQWGGGRQQRWPPLVSGSLLTDEQRNGSPAREMVRPAPQSTEMARSCLDKKVAYVHFFRLAASFAHNFDDFTLVPCPTTRAGSLPVEWAGALHPASAQPFGEQWGRPYRQGASTTRGQHVNGQPTRRRRRRLAAAAAGGGGGVTRCSGLTTCGWSRQQI